MAGIIARPLTKGGAGRTLDADPHKDVRAGQEEAMARTLGIRALAWLALLGAMAAVAHTVQTTLAL